MTATTSRSTLTLKYAGVKQEVHQPIRGALLLPSCGMRADLVVVTSEERRLGVRRRGEHGGNSRGKTSSLNEYQLREQPLLDRLELWRGGYRKPGERHTLGWPSAIGIDRQGTWCRARMWVQTPGLFRPPHLSPMRKPQLKPPEGLSFLHGPADLSLSIL